MTYPDKRDVARYLEERYDKKKQVLTLYNCPLWKDILTDNFSTFCILKSLILSYNKINDNTVELIASQKWLNLSQLWLNQNKITSTGAHSLARMESPFLSQLILSGNQIDFKGFIELASNKDKNIKYLSIGMNSLRRNISIYPFYSLEEGLSSMTKLSLQNNKLGLSGLRCIAKIELSRLRSVKLIQNNIGNEGVKALRKAKWPLIEDIEIGYNKIGHDGLLMLKELHFPLLKKLSLFYNQMNPISLISLTFLESKTCSQELCIWGVKNEKLQMAVNKLIKGLAHHAQEIQYQ